MGATAEVRRRVVFDTNTVVSALLFASGRLAWLRNHWRSAECTPLASRATISELQRVLSYPKFGLDLDERLELMGDYLPFCEIVEETRKCPQKCRDRHDQIFLDLSFSARAGVLVTGDRDLLALTGATPFSILSPEDYRKTCGP